MLPVRTIPIGILAAGALLSAQAPGQLPQITERVEVARVLVDVRVISPDGRPVLDLGAADFKVAIDGRPARVDSLDWVPGSAPAVALAAAPAPARAEAEAAVTPGGRLIVFLFQKEVEASRIGGLMRMLERAHDLVNGLAPTDRVAVLMFDSHLKLYADFTSDRAKLAPLLERAILFENPPVVEPAPAPSLAARLDRNGARRASTLEAALALIGEALEPLPGSKTLVLFAWGMGRMEHTHVVVDDDYAEARRALAAARVAVFSLDVTDADSHSLEAGLRAIADATGGFYERTHQFAGLAMTRLEGALAGHYVLIVEKPDAKRGTHTITVELVKRKGLVFARSSYVG
jgi:VWFA-related protein